MSPLVQSIIIVMVPLHLYGMENYNQYPNNIQPSKKKYHRHNKSLVINTEESLMPIQNNVSLVPTEGQVYHGPMKNGWISEMQCFYNGDVIGCSDHGPRVPLSSGIVSSLANPNLVDSQDKGLLLDEYIDLVSMVNNQLDEIIKMNGGSTMDHGTPYENHGNLIKMNGGSTMDHGNPYENHGNFNKMNGSQPIEHSAPCQSNGNFNDNFNEKNSFFNDIYIIQEEDESDGEDSIQTLDNKSIVINESIKYFQFHNPPKDLHTLEKKNSDGTFSKYLMPSPMVHPKKKPCHHRRIVSCGLPKKMPLSPSFKAQPTTFIPPLRSENTVIYEGTDVSLDKSLNGAPVKTMKKKSLVINPVHPSEKNKTSMVFQKSSTPLGYKKSHSFLESFEGASTSSGVSSPKNPRNSFIMNKIITLKKKIHDLKSSITHGLCPWSTNGNIVDFFQLFVKNIGDHIHWQDGENQRLFNLILEIVDELIVKLLPCFDDNHRDMLRFIAFNLDPHGSMGCHKSPGDSWKNQKKNPLPCHMVNFANKILQNHNVLWSHWNEKNLQCNWRNWKKFYGLIQKNFQHQEWKQGSHVQQWPQGPGNVDYQGPAMGFLDEQFITIEAATFDYGLALEKQLMIHQDQLNQLIKQYYSLWHQTNKDGQCWANNYEILWNNMGERSYKMALMHKKETIKNLVESHKKQPWVIKNHYISPLRGEKIIEEIAIQEVPWDVLWQTKLKSIMVFIDKNIGPLIKENHNNGTLDKEPLLEQLMLMVEELFFDILFFFHYGGIGFCVVDIKF